MKLQIDDIELEIALLNSPTAKKIQESLPIAGEINRWGDEIYFYVDIETPLEDNATDTMQVGDIAYWRPDTKDVRAIAIFFGPTPMSTDEKPKAASACNIFGRVKNAEILKKVKGDTITLS